MTTIRLFPQFVKTASLVFNGVVALFSLLMVPLYTMADIGESATPMMGWSILLAVAAFIIMAALFVSDRNLPLAWAAYGAAVFFLVASFWEWYEHFNLYSILSPPTGTVVCGLLAILNLTSLAMNRPIQLKSRSLRLLLIAIVIVVGMIVTIVATTLIVRIESQWSDAKHFLRLGGHVQWESGKVVAVQQRATATTDDDLRNLTHFPNLISLDLSDTHISDAGLAHIAELHSLEHLYLDKTAITDRGLSYLTGLTKLRNLWMHRTHVTDQGLVNLEGLTEMRYLDLGYTKVTDAGLPQLYGMKKMYYLHLVGTEVTDEGLRKIAAAISGLSTYNGRISIR